MAVTTSVFDLASLGLTSGEGRRLDLAVEIGSQRYMGGSYRVEPTPVPLQLDISCMSGGGYALALRFEAQLIGNCMRCLEEAKQSVSVEAREVEQARKGAELETPYVRDEIVELATWARDALMLSLSGQILCKPDCAGLCPECGVNLNKAGEEHSHEAPIDPRWAKLSELKQELED